MSGRSVVAAVGIAIALLTACSGPKRTVRHAMPKDAPTADQSSPLDSLPSAQPTPGIIEPHALAWGALSGTVTDESGHPIVGLCVRVETVRHKPPYPPQSGHFTCVETDRRGHYREYPLPTGDYRVAFAWNEVPAPDYFYQESLTGGERWVPEFFDDRVKYQDAEWVHVERGKETSHIDARLVVGGSITGKITGTDGASLEFACATVRAADDPEGFFQADETDANGNFVLRGIPAGRYKVEFVDMCHWRDGNDWLQPRPIYQENKEEFYPNAGDWEHAGVLTISLGEHIASINGRLEAPPKWADLSVEEVTVVGPAADVGEWLARIRVDIANVGNLSLGGTNEAYVRVWARSPDGTYEYITPAGGGSYGVPVPDPFGPGQHFGSDFNWKGRGSTDGWSIVAAVCVYEPGWDRSLSNNVERLSPDGSRSLAAPPYSERCDPHRPPPGAN